MTKDRKEISVKSSSLVFLC